MRCKLLLSIGFGLVVSGCAARLSGESLARESVISAVGTPAAGVSFSVLGAPDNAGAPVEGALPLEQAVRDALGTHPEIQSALARVWIAQAEADQARLLPNPILTVVLRFPEGGAQPIVEAGLAAELLSLLQRPGRVSAADHRLWATSADAVTTVLDVLSDVQGHYVEVQSLDARLAVLREREGLLTRLTELARNRLDAGEGIRLDVTTAETQSVELEIEMDDLKARRAEARLELARLVGRPSDPAGWALDPWQPPPPVAGGEGEWVAAALQHRPEITAQAAELAALGVEVNLARWAILDGSEAGIDAEHEESAWSAGPAVSVPLPLFDWGQAKRAKARAERSQAMHEMTGIRRRVIEEVRKAHAALALHAESLGHVRDQLLPLLERRREESESAYKAGQIDITPMILAEQELRAGRVRLIELQQAVSQATIRLHRAVGGPGRAPGESPTPKLEETP